MKISFVLPPVSMSGGIRVVAIYAKALVERGHDVVLVSPPHEGIPFRRKIKSFLTGSGWPKFEWNISHLDGLGLDHRVLERCRPVYEKDIPDADVVIATWWETAEWVNALGDGKGAKVYFVQGHEVHEHLPVERCRATYFLPLRKIVVADWLRAVMRDDYGDQDVFLVPNSVDHEQFFSAERGKQSSPTVGFMYSRSKIKGVAVTMHVLDGLRSAVPNLKVVSFGACLPQESDGFDDRIEFHLSPDQSRIRELYSKCDVWITASKSEGFNLPAMEAMACRTPVVSTITGWPAEAIESGQNGVLAEIDDVVGLTLGVESIFAMTDLQWREMSEKAYVTVASSSWQKSASQFEKALECVIQQHESRKKFAGRQ